MCRNVVEEICLSKIKKALKKNDFRNDCHVHEKDTEREHIALWGNDNYKYLEKIVWNADKMQCVAVGTGKFVEFLSGHREEERKKL